MESKRLERLEKRGREVKFNSQVCWNRNELKQRSQNNIATEMETIRIKKLKERKKIRKEFVYLASDKESLFTVG